MIDTEQNASYLITKKLDLWFVIKPPLRGVLCNFQSCPSICDGREGSLLSVVLEIKKVASIVTKIIGNVVWQVGRGEPPTVSLDEMRLRLTLDGSKCDCFGATTFCLLSMFEKSLLKNWQGAMEISAAQLLIFTSCNGSHYFHSFGVDSSHNQPKQHI